jgi:hypothetical protein
MLDEIAWDVASWLQAPTERSIKHVGSAPSIGRRSISCDLIVEPI